MTYSLPRTEADVVITFRNVDMGRGMVTPYWECEMTQDDLYAGADRVALLFAERCGGGAVEYEIIDYRK